MTVNLKRMRMAEKFNDGGAEKRKRRKSAKLLGQQSTMFDGLTDPGSAVDGLNEGSSRFSRIRSYLLHRSQVCGGLEL